MLHARSGDVAFHAGFHAPFTLRANTRGFHSRSLPVLFRLSVWRNRWFATEFPSLPAIDMADDDACDYGQLVRGLADLLSQCSPRGAERHFPASLHGFRRLKRQIKRGSAPALSAQNLSDLCHEIAQYTDAATLEAGLRCLRRSAARPAEASTSSSSLPAPQSTVFAPHPAQLPQAAVQRRR